MSKKIIFVDFDGTLFDRWQFLKWIGIFLESYGVKKGEFIASARDFYKADGMYDNQNHIKAITGKEWDFVSGEIEQAVKSQNLQFYYDDALKFLQKAQNHKDFEVRILTYGDADFQRFKLGLCREIVDMSIPVHVTQQQKKDFLKKNFQDQTGILVDDKYPLGLWENWEHIWVNRPKDSAYNKTQLPKSSQEREVTSLDDITLL